MFNFVVTLVVCPFLILIIIASPTSGTKVKISDGDVFISDKIKNCGIHPKLIRT